MTTTKLKVPLKLDPVTFPTKGRARTKSILKKNYNRSKRKSTKPHLKFAGPIKIMIIEPKTEYCKTVWCAVAVGLSHICIGATNFTILHYTLHSGDSHATICCLAFHFFSAEAILCLNYANGWSTPMRQRHRKLVHVFMQICGVTCAITGTVLAILAKGVYESLHVLSGLIAAILAGLSVMSGVFALLGFRRRPWLIMFHLVFGIPAFLMSSISLCSGVFSKTFKEWADGTIAYILLGLITFYTAYIVGSSVFKCISKM